MTVEVIASGSRGNCTLVVHGDTYVLVDVGLPWRRICEHLARRGIAPHEIDGILVTHEHQDHAKAAKDLRQHLGIPTFMSVGTSLALDFVADHLIEDRYPFVIGDIAVFSCPVPHDAKEPLAFRLDADGERAAIVTDLGSIPEDLALMIHNCDTLLIEANYDQEMLNVCQKYPPKVRQRIGSDVGHLSNQALSTFIRTTLSGRIKRLIIGHLSEETNRVPIATMNAQLALRRSMLSATLEVVPPGESK